MSTPIENTIKEAVNRLVNKFSPEQIILFGSQARGTADEKSDVDFLVITTFEKSRKVELANQMYKEISDLMVPIDIVIISKDQFIIDSKIPGTIARPASKEGKILYSNAS